MQGRKERTDHYRPRRRTGDRRRTARFIGGSFVALSALALASSRGLDGTCDDWDSERFLSWVTADSIAGCLEAGWEVNVRNVSGQTPLHVMVQGGRPMAVPMLLEAGAEVNARDREGRTPLHLALQTYQSRSPFLVAWLLEAGAEVDARDDAGRTPLHYEALRRVPDPTVIEALVKAGADVNAHGVAGETPLHLAIRGNRPPAGVKKLLELGADRTARDDEGVVADPARCEHWSKAIFFATADEKIVKECLEAGASVDTTNESGLAPLHLAASFTQGTGVIEALLEGGADPGMLNRALYLAAGSNENLSVIETLIGRGGDVNAGTEEGRTPLSRAIRNENPAVIRALIEASTGLHTPSGLAHLTVLARGAARSNRNPDVIKALIESGADVKARDGEGMTLLHRAAAGANNSGVIEVLVQAGVPLDARDQWGRTALHDCVPIEGQRWSVETIAALVKAGIDVNARANGGETALHHSLTRWNMWRPEAMAELTLAVVTLLGGGADPNVRDEGGGTALHAAVSWWSGSRDLVVALVKAGAEVNARDDERPNPSSRGGDDGGTEVAPVHRHSGGARGGGERAG